MSADITKLAVRDYSFRISAVTVEPFDDLDHTVPVEPHAKSYGFDGDELHGYLDGDGRALFVAEAAGGPVAYVAVSRGWNGYAVVDDIAVDAAHRGGGTGRRLMDAVVGWARSEMLEGVRLETQSNNLAA
ncbi:GNAT family N-acetyltransferase, partial [Rhizobiaceae sp. 2RAB30]